MRPDSKLARAMVTLNNYLRFFNFLFVGYGVVVFLGGFWVCVFLCFIIYF